jgi:pimeloyl-ACP methyl ester carboxylesterase
VVSVVEGRMPLAGGAIAYTKAGTGPVVLLIHGLGGTRRTWRHLLTPLGLTHTVIAPDLPGHGQSDPPAGDYSLGAHACAMRDLLLTLGHHRATIVGHSLGGGVALQTAYQFPERTERIVLISSGGLGAEVTPILCAATLPGADPVVAALSALPAALTQRLFDLLPALIGHSDRRVLAEVLRGLTDEQQRRAFLRTARTVIDWRGQTVSATRQLGLLRDVPLLVAWGADDKTIPPAHHHALATQVSHAVTVEIAGAGHYPHETAPEQVLSAMQTFLSATQPFRYREDRWVQQLIRPHPGNGGHPRYAETAGAPLPTST